MKNMDKGTDARIYEKQNDPFIEITVKMMIHASIYITHKR